MEGGGGIHEHTQGIVEMIAYFEKINNEYLHFSEK